MGRNVRPNQDAAPTPLFTDAEPQAPMEGGTAGVPPEPDNAIVTHSRVVGSAQRAADPNAPPPPKPKQYKVLNGGHVMYDSCRTAIRAGKIVDETSYDIELLKRQGIQLQEVEG